MEDLPFHMPKKLTVEDILSDELKREMNLDTDTFAVLDDWDSVMHSVYQMPIEYAGYTRKVSDMKLLKEMVSIISLRNFMTETLLVNPAYSMRIW